MINTKVKIGLVSLLMVSAFIFGKYKGVQKGIEKEHSRNEKALQDCINKTTSKNEVQHHYHVNAKKSKGNVILKPTSETNQKNETNNAVDTIYIGLEGVYIEMLNRRLTNGQKASNPIKLNNRKSLIRLDSLTTKQLKRKGIRF